MCDCKSLRTCSGCHSTKLEQHFSINAKGCLYKLCNNCLANKRKHNEKVRSAPLEDQYLICELCGGRVHKLNEGMSRHKKRWTCVKKTLSGQPGKKEFYEFVLANQVGGLKDYDKYVEDTKIFLGVD